MERIKYQSKGNGHITNKLYKRQDISRTKMSFLTTTLAFFFGTITGSTTNYFIQRYFFKKFLDNTLDGFENKIINGIKRKWQTTK